MNSIVMHGIQLLLKRDEFTKVVNTVHYILWPGKPRLKWDSPEKNV